MCGILCDHAHEFDERETPPHYLKNRFIKSGYRVCKNHRQCLQTLWKLDNETMNVWTVVLFGVLPLLWLCIDVAQRWPQHIDLPDDVSIPIALAGIVAAFGNFFATMAYHLFCSNPRYYHFWSACDLFGIALALLAYALGLISVGFHYPLFPQSMSLSSQALVMIVFSLGFGLVIARYRVRIRRESPLWLLAVNVCLGLGVTLPLFLYHRHSSTRAACTIILLLGGLALYVGKVPERFPLVRHHALDLIGNSHQIWHACYCLSLYTFYSDLLHASSADAAHVLGYTSLWR